ncbi:MAG: glycosyltransferase family 2 protein [Bryobacteraceae bacterium]|jgi:GT2 family glycosyltransferase
MTPVAPRVAVAIPTLLAGSMLETCLLALDRQTWPDFEVIVIDNGSVCAQPDASLFRFPLRVLRPGYNLGFGAAINLAVESTKAVLIAALNDDTEADPDWLAELVREVESGPRVGMCASSIRVSRSGRLDSAGMSICLDGSSKQRGGSMPLASFARSEDVLFPSACAALYRRAMLEDIGMFDSDFFLYCEDTDLGLRAVWAGWQCRYAARAGVRHGYSRTAQPYSSLKARYVERNRLWVALKSFPFPLLFMVPFTSFARYFCQLWQVFFGSGAAAEFVASGFSIGCALGIVIRAHFETLWHLPELLRKRAAIAATRRIGSREFIRLIMRHRITVRELARAC